MPDVDEKRSLAYIAYSKHRPDFLLLPGKMNLCSKCYSALQQSAHSVDDTELLQHLVAQAGFESIDAAKRDLAFR